MGSADCGEEYRRWGSALTDPGCPHLASPSTVESQIFAVPKAPRNLKSLDSSESPPFRAAEFFRQVHQWSDGQFSKAWEMFWESDSALKGGSRDRTTASLGCLVLSLCEIPEKKKATGEGVSGKTLYTQSIDSAWNTNTFGKGLNFIDAGSKPRTHRDAVLR